MVLWVANPSLEEDEARTGPHPNPQPPRLARATAPQVSLSPDALRSIVFRVVRPADLASIALVSRYLNTLATPLLYSTLAFGPTAFYRNTGPERNRSSHSYVSTSAESPSVRTDVGAEDNFFDNRSSLCAETLAAVPHLLVHVRTLSTHLTVPNYGTAVRACRGQRSSEENAFREWSALLALPEACNLRHLALGGVTDHHLRELCLARHLKLVALELSVPPSALPELPRLATLLQRQRLVTHFASRNLTDIKGLHGEYIPRLASIDVPAALARQLAPGRPIMAARVFPVTTRRAVGMNSADEVLMAINALSQSTNPLGVTSLDVSVLWFGDSRMGDDCSAFFAAVRDSLRGLRRLRITLWSDLAPNNVDILFDCVSSKNELVWIAWIYADRSSFVTHIQIMNTLPALEFLESFEVRTWAEYGINHPSHVPQTTRRALFDLWKELCPSLVRVSAIERHSWVWHVSRPHSPQPGPRRTPSPLPVRSNSDPDNVVAGQQRPLPPRPRPASGDWVRNSGRWDWKPTSSPLAQTSFDVASPVPSTSRAGPSIIVEPVSRGGTPDAYRSLQAEGSWVREREKSKFDHECSSWHSDLQVLGSTYQRNWQDEHYINVARSSDQITFASPPV
ncbi:glycoside hydrolase family 43 protein [Ceratobasidium sp. AG-Ba]|nr:glycoside hydrolase family 43 protein [Ceratobasidium sp. AG-Ba]